MTGFPGHAVCVFVCGAFAFLLPGGAFAQGAQPSVPKPQPHEGCPGLVAHGLARVMPAALTIDQVRLTFIGHSTFLIESPKGIRIATDYNDYVRPPVRPDVITMNHAHSTHYTDRPDPAIAHVLRGWSSEYGKPARYDVQIKDVRIRNVPTNIRDYAGGTEPHGNSIFIFEIGSLCIAHLGHLHHTLTQQQLDEIGRIDVVLVPVDGSYTLDLDGMIDVLKSLKAPLMIPMHYFSTFTLERFLSRIRDTFAVEMGETQSVVLSRATLPASPKFLVLPGR